MWNGPGNCTFENLKSSICEINNNFSPKFGETKQSCYRNNWQFLDYTTETVLNYNYKHLIIVLISDVMLPNVLINSETTKSVT